MLQYEPDLLKGMSGERLTRALSLGSRISLGSGTDLFALGDQAERIFIMERGRIRLTLPIQLRGRNEDVLVEERFPGQTVGWSALIPPHCFTLKATAPLDSDLIAFARTDLNRLFEEQPEIGYNVFQNLAAIIGHRLQLFQAMWLREMQRTVELRCR